MARSVSSSDDMEAAGVPLCAPKLLCVRRARDQCTPTCCSSAAVLVAQGLVACTVTMSSCRTSEPASSRGWVSVNCVYVGPCMFPEKIVFDARDEGTRKGRRGLFVDAVPRVIEFLSPSINRLSEGAIRTDGKAIAVLNAGGRDARATQVLFAGLTKKASIGGTVPCAYGAASCAREARGEGVQPVMVGLSLTLATHRQGARAAGGYRNGCAAAVAAVAGLYGSKAILYVVHAAIIERHAPHDDGGGA